MVVHAITIALAPRASGNRLSIVDVQPEPVDLAARQVQLLGDQVDRRACAHPAVAQAVTFAMPHDRLGEEVAAAVVLRDGEESDERAIRKFVGERVADFKTPRRVVILDEIPKGATGKIQRIGLAERLGLTK